MCVGFDGEEKPAGGSGRKREIKCECGRLCVKFRVCYRLSRVGR
jgi:hypothetical protein